MKRMNMKDRGPWPGGPEFLKTIAANMQAPLVVSISGEITASDGHKVMGAASVDGKVVGAYLSVKERGVDGTNDLYLEADLFVNGTTFLATKPKIEAGATASGGGQADTFDSGTGITQAVFTGSGEVRRGDVFTCSFELTRTTPDTEMTNAVFVVDFVPLR
jgi:hypothetical protein